MEINIIVMQDFNVGPESFQKGDIIYTGEEIELQNVFHYVNGRYRCDIPLELLQIIKLETQPKPNKKIKKK